MVYTTFSAGGSNARISCGSAAGSDLVVPCSALLTKRSECWRRRPSERLRHSDRFYSRGSGLSEQRLDGGGLLQGHERSPDCLERCFEIRKPGERGVALRRQPHLRDRFQYL